MPFVDAFRVDCSVSDVRSAVEFYRRLGFRIVDDSGTSSVRVTDGRVAIDLREAESTAVRLTLIVPSLEGAARAVDASGATCETHSSDRFSFTDPGGLVVHVVESSHERIADIPLSRCGTFGEISVLTSSADRSHAFWGKLGFEPTWFPPPPRRVGSMSDGVLNIGFYEPGTCPHAFRSPAVTFFEDDMFTRLHGLKADGWTFPEEMPAKGGDPLGHAILDAPGGLHLFLFGTY